MKLRDLFKKPEPLVVGDEFVIVGAALIVTPPAPPPIEVDDEDTAYGATDEGG